MLGYGEYPEIFEMRVLLSVFLTLSLSNGV
jgi:hypothetical protein